MLGFRRSVGVLAVVLCCGGTPSVARAGWIILASGTSGSARPTETTEFWYGSSSTSNFAIDTISGVMSVRAVTAGGVTYFSGLGTPVLLDLSDGSAYLASGNPPTSAMNRGPGGTSAGPLASAVPRTGLPTPPDAVRLGVVLGPDSGGVRLLTASLVEPEGGRLVTGSVVVPESGWWVLGLGPEQEPRPAPLPQPMPAPPPSPSAVPGVPEPATVTLAALGSVLLLLWRLRNAGPSP